MNNNKAKIVLKIVIMFIFILITYYSVVSANPITEIYNKRSEPAGMSDIVTLRGKIYTVYRIIGTGVAVIAVLALAVKYITSSPNDRADLKKAAITYVIAASLFFGSIGFVEILKAFGQEIF